MSDDVKKQWIRLMKDAPDVTQVAGFEDRCAFVTGWFQAAVRDPELAARITRWLKGGELN